MLTKFHRFNRLIQPLFLLSWVIVFLFAPAASVQAKAVVYDGRDGLNSNDISSIVKDNRGLMWIGTVNGLNIFDGYTFSKFEGILASRSIITLKLSTDNNELFVGTTIGLYVIDLNNLVTTKIRYNDPNHPDPSLSVIRKICYKPDTKEVFYTIRNLIYQVADNNTAHFVSEIQGGGPLISNVKPYDKDHLLVNNGAMYMVNVRTGKSEPVKISEKIKSIDKMYTSGDTILICDVDARLYITHVKDYQNNPPAFPLTDIRQLPYKPVKSYLKGNKLYSLCEDYSFIIYDLKTGITDYISQKYPDIFEGKVFYSLYVDENNIIWIGTNKGLIKVEDRAVSFSKVLGNLPGRVSTRKIYEEKNGDLYVCSYAGLWQFSKQTQQWIKFTTAPPKLANEPPNITNKQIFPLSILPGPTENIFYVGYDSDQLLYFDKTRKIYESANIKYNNPPSTILNTIYDMVPDNNGTVWIGAYNGVATYNPTTNTARLHRQDAFSIGDARVRMLYHDKERNLMYVGATNGLFIFDINKGLLHQFSTGTVPALNNNDVLFVGKDKQNNIWLGTNGGGINVISADLKNIRYIRKQDGLSSEIVYSMLPENDNVRWIATFNGLDRYQIDKKTFTNFFEEDGISSNEFNQNSFLKTVDGKFYFGSINGITTFYPQQFIEPEPFRIYFAGLSKWDNKTQSIHLYLKNLLSGNTIVKTPSDQLIELHFGCTDYSDPQRNSYSYRIKEISNNWISLEDRHSLNIGGLPYGQFTLEIRAINARGAASSNVLTYYLKISQPFYKTWWFFGLILISIAMIFYVAYLIKSHNFKNVLHLRMKIASNLHDEVGSLLTRITMFSDNLRYSKNNEEQRNIKLEKIAILSRNAVASMSDVLWAIDSRNDFAGNLLDRMREQAEEMLFPLGIDVNFVLSISDLKKHIDSDTRGEVYLIFKEAINNIVKHSNATHVEINYKLLDKHFELKISNNGIIESISEISTGQGLNNMKMRAKKIGAQITIERKGDIFFIELKN
jgi:ligand-binding sensor domain-containing protein